MKTQNFKIRNNWNRIYLNELYLPVLFLFLVFYVLNSFCVADWSSDPGINVAVSTSIGTQPNFNTVSDGLSGVIVIWFDSQNIYAQAVDSAGNIKWTPNGLLIFSSPNLLGSPLITSDSAGGAIICWTQIQGNNTNFDIYAQAIDSIGNLKWGSNGLPIVTLAGRQSASSIVSDGAGGAIIAYDDSQNVGSYLQAVDKFGSLKWNTNGVPIVSGLGESVSPTMIEDGLGGAILAWADNRTHSYSHIYAQAIDSNGNVKWTSNGIPICTANMNQSNPRLVSNGNGGAIIAWNDNRNYNNTNQDVYAQSINSNGTLQWASNGMAITSAPGYQGIDALISDGNGGVIVVYDDSVNNYFQAISSSGMFRWLTTEKPCCEVSDGNGGAIISWNDNRNQSSTGIDIYAQALNKSGKNKWLQGDIAVCTAVNNQTATNCVTDLQGGTILIWADYRYGTTYSIFCQRVFSNGSLGSPAEIPVKGDIVYTYDNTYRLVTCAFTNGVSIVYNYDSSGNRSGKTVTSKLLLSLGSNNPSPITIPASTTDVSLLEVHLQASNAEDIQLTTLNITFTGTGDPSNDILTIKMYNYGDGQLGDTTTFANNGIATFTGLSKTIPAGTGIDLLFVATIVGSGNPNKTYGVKLAKNSDVGSIGLTSGQFIYPLGAPITGQTDSVVPVELSNFELAKKIDSNPSK